MKTVRSSCFLFLVAGAAILSRAGDVAESARLLPVAYDVDVVVVGGSSAGVAAAVEAAKNGAKVFVAAPRPYLGDDICATYRLWLEPGEVPVSDLAKEVFLASAPEAAIGSGLPITYTTDKKPFSKHADTTPPSRLSDGIWNNSAKESVQYNDDVTIIADLGTKQDVKAVHVMAYQRANDFSVKKIDVSVSDDKQLWKPLGVITNAEADQGTYEEAAIDLVLKTAVSAKFVKFAVQKTDNSDRVLLGEIVVEGTGDAQKAAKIADTIVVKPMQVKRALDKALIKAGVPFLYASYVTDLLRDSNGKPAGIVMANRAGRQAVIAKVIIDATENAAVAHMAGAMFTPFKAGPQTFSRIVLGGPVVKGEGISVRERAKPVEIVDNKGIKYPVIEYELKIPMEDSSFGSLAKAEQIARDWTWTREQVDSAEILTPATPETIRGKKSETAWSGADKLALDALQPAELERLFVLSAHADVTGDASKQLSRPVNAMDVGARVGVVAAALAKNTGTPSGAKLAAGKSGPVVSEVGDVKCTGPELNPRFSKAKTVPSEKQNVPVIGEYDVIVVGGGTGGAPAASGAGRQGAKTLLVEYLTQLGGVGTVGGISTYYHGNRVGFTHEIDTGVAELEGPDAGAKSGSWVPTTKAEWLRKDARKYGVDTWFGSLGIGAYVEGGRVCGVEVATPQGRGVVRGKVVIDATGGADIAAAAGAECVLTSESEVAVQGTGLPPRMLGGRYINTDYTYVDDSDIFDITRAYAAGREKFKSAYDLGQLIDTRERRRIIGDVTLTPMDALIGRTWPDTIEIAKSNFDSHGYTIHELFLLRHPNKEDVMTRVPYRALLPRGLDGILVIGLGVSTHRDTLPLIRMQPDIQNQGYAAGVAAAMLAKSGKPTREVDLKALQQHLVDHGNIPASVLTEKDSFPLPKERIAEAVKQVAKEYAGLEVLLTQRDDAKPLLRDAFKAATDPKVKLIYAHILAMLGDSTGADVLINEISKNSWDNGWRFTGMGQFGASISPLDSLIIAAGRCGDKRALAPIIEKTKLLKAGSEFSHFRAVALALESFGDKSAAQPLAELLQKPGISGHAITNIEAATAKNPASGTDNSTRHNELAELDLARALYRCGDYNGIGEKILRDYATDLRGYYARNAMAVLEPKK